MSILIGLAACALVIAWAVKGYAYRALYVGAALVSGTFGGCFALITDPQALATATASDAAQQRGAQLLADYGLSWALVFLLIAFGAVVGAVVYRAPRA
jgi:hypothetical protein